MVEDRPGEAENEPEELEPAEPQTANAGVTFEPAPEDDPEEFRFHTGTTHASKAPPAVQFIDVHKSFGRNHVLRGLNLEIPEGQVSMIIGPSGTGKSVCIKHIVGLLYPDQGDVIVHGQSIPSLAAADLLE